MPIDRWLTRWSANYAFLRRAVDAVGRELARRPYDALLQEGEELSFTQFFDGEQVDFEVEVFRIDRDRTMWVRVVPGSDRGTPLDLKPSYVFRKLPDGRAYRMRR